MGVMMPHSVGIIDPFYRGSENEIKLLFYNFSKEKVSIYKGDKIAQGILVKYEKVEFDETVELGGSEVRTWKANKRRGI